MSEEFKEYKPDYLDDVPTVGTGDGSLYNAGSPAAGEISDPGVAYESDLSTGAGTTSYPAGRILESANFVSGTAGWQIDGKGNAEFQNITARGDITADNLYIGGIIEITAQSGDNLQTHLNTINTQGGGTLRLSPGTYTQTTDLTVYDNTQIIGDSSGNTIIDFDSNSASITWTGTDTYSTGTVAVNKGSTTVTGTGTTWTTAMIGRQIFISNRWYVIAAVTPDTSITLATNFADANVSGAAYVIANPINNVSLQHLTIKNSAADALTGIYIRDVYIEDVFFLTNNVGFDLDYFMNIVVVSTICAASVTDGYQLTKGSFFNCTGFASTSNGTGASEGAGAKLNDIKACTFIWSSMNANLDEGVEATDVNSCEFKIEASGNTEEGIEFVSGCNNNFVTDSLIVGNTGDNIKFTATSDTNTIGPSCNITDGSGWGISFAAGCDNNRVIGPYFNNNSSGNISDSGSGNIHLPAWNVLDEDTMVSDSATAMATQQSIKAYVDSQVAAASGNFGGTGADSSLSVTSGTTNIDASSANVVVKNYTTISISSGATLGLTNPASNGTILILRATGNVTIEGTIDLSSDGAAAATNGFSILDANSHLGGAGTNSAPATPGAGGTGGVIYSNKEFYITDDANKLYRRFLNVACGSGGGKGGNGDSGCAGGAGGRGGGALIIECAGALDFDAGGIINVSGGSGSKGTNGNGAAGGGGGGAAGMALILYSSLTDNSGTINAKGGAGGAGGDVSGGAGDPGGGGGAGGGSWTRAGANGGTGANSGAAQPGGAGGNSTDSNGAGGGGGAHGAQPAGSGGTAGATDANHYLVAQNIYLA